MLEKSAWKRKLRYYDPVVRHDSLEHKIMFGMMDGMKRQGGQKKQWIEDICTWASTATTPVPVAPNARLLKAYLKSVLEMMEMARDRDIWRRAVQDFASPTPRVG